MHVHRACLIVDRCGVRRRRGLRVGGLEEVAVWVAYLLAAVSHGVLLEGGLPEVLLRRKLC